MSAGMGGESGGRTGSGRATREDYSGGVAAGGPSAENGLPEKVVVVTPLELQFGQLVVGLLVAVRSILGLRAVVRGLELVLMGVGGAKYIEI